MKHYIQINVPMCPRCAEMLMHLRTEHKYKCRLCMTTYKIVGVGATDREIICEEETHDND